MSTRLPRGASVPIWLILGGVLALAVAVKYRFNVPWYVVMGDPATATGSPFFAGFVSNVGAVMWAAIATVFLFRFHLDCRPGRPSEWTRFLLWSGLFAALVGSDDLFLLHEELFPKYLSIPQVVVVATYGVLAIAYLGRFRTQIARTAYPLFLLALGLLGVSVALDQIADRWEVYLPAGPFIEDGAKLLGIGTWLSYAWHTCSRPPTA